MVLHLDAPLAITAESPNRFSFIEEKYNFECSSFTFKKVRTIYTQLATIHHLHLPPWLESTCEMTLVEPFLGCSNRTGLPERTKLMRQMVGRLVTCSRRERNNFCCLTLHKHLLHCTVCTTGLLTSIIPALHTPRSAAKKTLLLCRAKESLILYYSVPCTAMELSCHVSSFEPRPTFNPPRGKEGGGGAGGLRLTINPNPSKGDPGSSLS